MLLVRKPVFLRSSTTSRDGALRPSLFRFARNKFSLYANVVQTATQLTFFRSTDTINWRQQIRSSVICLWMRISSSSRLYHPFYLTRRILPWRRGTRDNAYSQIRLLCPANEKIIQTMVDYRRGRREMLALAGTQGIAFLPRETNRERSYDSFDFPLVPKYRQLSDVACMLNIYDFPQAHWSRAVRPSTMKRNPANGFHFVFAKVSAFGFRIKTILST